MAMFLDNQSKNIVLFRLVSSTYLRLATVDSTRLLQRSKAVWRTPLLFIKLSKNRRKTKQWDDIYKCKITTAVYPPRKRKLINPSNLETIILNFTTNKRRERFIRTKIRKSKSAKNKMFNRAENKRSIF
jgi:hypothetical protein